MTRITHWSTLIGCLATLHVAGAAEPLPLSTSYWKEKSFLKSFNGSYRIEARIEPVVSTEVRGLLVEMEKLMDDGKRESAIEKIKESSLTKDSPALQFNLGNLYFEEGELEEAAAAYTKALDGYPSFRRAHRNLGMVLVRQDELEEGLEHLIEAMRLGDSDGATYGLVGFCRLQRGEWASALQAYRMAQLSQPDSPEWKSGVAQCLQNLDLEVEAVALLDEVIRDRPLEPSYALLQASILVELDRHDDAIKALEMPARLGRLNGDGLLQLADLHLRESLVEAAQSAITEAFALETAPSMDMILTVIASAMRVNEWEIAGDLIEKATPEEGDMPRALRRASALLDIESDRGPERGETVLRELIATEPTDATSLIALGRHLASKKQLDEAELLLMRATSDTTLASDAWVEITRVRVEQKRYTKALEAIDSAIAARPDSNLQAYRDSLAKLVEASR